MCRYGVVTFLENAENIQGVDPWFRSLANYFHRIPYCATFGVSCSGHFYIEEDGTFWPRPDGNLNILIDPSLPHVAALKGIIDEVIAKTPDSSFKKIDHVFGPPEDAPIEVWEIRIGDNGCLSLLGDDYYGGYIPVSDNRETFDVSRKRCEEIRMFWLELTKRVKKFCEANHFESFNLEARVRELNGAFKKWKQEVEKSA